MLPVQIALTSLTNQVGMAELARVATALHKQAVRDFGPLWNVDAQVDAFPIDRIPIGWWPIIVQDVLDEPDAPGVHRTEVDDTPYVLIPYGETWSLSASHECLDMLADPSGSRKIAGEPLERGRGRVEYLLEVCAPCEDIANAYTIDGIVVSDFCTPRYYNTASRAQAPCSFTGALDHSLQILPNGSLAWFADDGLIYQARAQADGRVVHHGGFSAANRNGQLVREFVNNLLPDRHLRLASAEPSSRLHALAWHGSGRLGSRFRDDIAWRFGFASPGRPARWGNEAANKRPAPDEA